MYVEMQREDFQAIACNSTYKMRAAEGNNLTDLIGILLFSSRLNLSFQIAPC